MSLKNFGVKIFIFSFDCFKSLLFPTYFSFNECENFFLKFHNVISALFRNKPN